MHLLLAIIVRFHNYGHNGKFTTSLRLFPTAYGSDFQLAPSDVWRQPGSNGVRNSLAPG